MLGELLDLVRSLVLDDTAGCGSPLESIDLPALTAGTWQQVTLAVGNDATDWDRLFGYAQAAMARYERGSGEEGGTDQVELIYTRFLSMGSQKVDCQKTGPSIRPSQA